MTNAKKTICNFKCSECNHQWKSSNATENDGQECRKCSSIVIPFETIKKTIDPASDKIVDSGKHLFGCFSCLDCNRQWRSSHAKENSGQKCGKCLKIVLPFELNEKKKKTKSPPKKLEGGQFVGRFNCLECNIEWKSSDAYGPHGQECIKCLKAVVPHVIISIKELKSKEPVSCRYKCLECKRDWTSSQLKNGKQKCKTCKKMVLPHQHQSELPSVGHGEIKPNKQHPKELCGEGIKLGRYCKKLKNLKDGTNI